MSDLEDVASSLAFVMSLLRRRLRQLPVDDGISAPELSALARLDRFGPASNSELARAEQISPQSMGATLAGLEERGLIVRSADATDRRRVVLTLTAAGREVVQQRRSLRAQQIAAALAGLSEDELAALRAAAPVIEKVAYAL